MGERKALLVASFDYEDPKLQRLRSPGEDVQDLWRVLRDPNIGGFDVNVLTNPLNEVLRRKISSFFGEAARNDFLLLHVACHGVKDEDGRLYFAAADTEIALLAATAVRSDFVNEAMFNSRSNQIVLLLDCCYSGAFSKGMAPKADDGVHLKERLHGSGRATITASDATEYAWEGQELTGEGVTSVFTRAVVEGLERGEADVDRDGQVSIDDLYDYVDRRSKAESWRQTPRKWDDLSGDLYVARNPKAAEQVTLPDEIVSALESENRAIRLSVLGELKRLALGPHMGHAAAARWKLKDLATNDDSGKVREAAAKTLAVLPPLPVDAEEAERKAREEAERKAREEAERKARKEAERKARLRRRLLMGAGVLVAIVAVVVAVFIVFRSSGGCSLAVTGPDTSQFECGSGAVFAVTYTRRLNKGKGPAFVALGSKNGSAAVWTSKDGRAWDSANVEASADVSDQSIRGVTSTSDGGLVAVGSQTVNGGTDAAVWTSAGPDFGDWQSIDNDQFGGSGDQQMNRVTKFGTGWVAVGFETVDRNTDAAVWVSRGRTIRKHIPDPGREGDQVMTRVVTVREGQSGHWTLVAVGHETVRKNDEDAVVWTSDNGESWTLASALDGSFSGPRDQAIFDANVHKGRIVAVGRAGEHGSAEGAVWESTSGGYEWRRIGTTGLNGPGIQTLTRVVFASQALVDQRVPLFLAGGTSASHGEKDAAMWTSNDAVSWDRLDVPGLANPMANQNVSSLSADSQPIVAVGSDGDHATIWTQRVRAGM